MAPPVAAHRGDTGCISMSAHSEAVKSLQNTGAFLIFFLNWAITPRSGVTVDQIVREIVRFERFALDLNRGCVLIDSQIIDLRPKTFEVLRHLAANAGHLVSKDDLYEAAWPGVIVGDDSLTQCIHELRQLLGDSDRRLIKTIARRGYLLDALPIASPVAASPSIAADQSRTAEGPIKAASRPRWRTWTVVAICASIVAAAGVLVFFSDAANRTVAATSKNAPPNPAFKDCDLCPEMVALPAGEFMMGSPDSEAGREGQEGPPRRVVLTEPVAIGKFEITVDQFAAFVAESGFETGDLCHAFVLDARPSEWPPLNGSFRAPGFRVTGSHPVVCVNWHDARAYTTWLASKTGRPYRLPTEAEWEYAARAGTTTAYSFGNDADKLCEFARFADGDSSFPWRSGCHSGAFEPGALRVGMLAPNPWGLFDMHGNAWEWTEDCWTSEPRLLPLDGSAFTRREDCDRRTMRGGGWAAERRRTRSAQRQAQSATARYYHLGFRVALPLASR
jgi:formylglycine-generating enzyme required for sulfatase activity